MKGTVRRKISYPRYSFVDRVMFHLNINNLVIYKMVYCGYQEGGALLFVKTFHTCKQSSESIITNLIDRNCPKTFTLTDFKHQSFDQIVSHTLKIVDYLTFAKIQRPFL